MTTLQDDVQRLAQSVDLLTQSNQALRSSALEVLLNARSLAGYSALRTFGVTNVTGIRLTNNGVAGFFTYDAADTSSTDNGGTILVDALGRRWKRVYEGAVSVKWFGAKGDGVADDTPAFVSTQKYLADMGGGLARLVFGTYKLTDFTMDRESVVFQGDTSGFGYSPTLGSVRIVPGATAVYAVRFKGTRLADDVVINAAAYSGFKNVQFLYTSGTADYGVFIDCGATVLDNVIIEGFPYNCMCADQMNANQFDKVTFLKAKKVNFTVIEHQANSYINPRVPDVSAWSSTSWAMNDCRFRESDGFGVVFRSGINVTFRDCGFESNKQGGMYIYRPNNSTVRLLKLDNGCWFENNYEAYANDPLAYTIEGNRAFLIGDASTYIAWSAAYQAGYALVSDSQTHYGGGGDHYTFEGVTFVGTGAKQKTILILSGFKYDFRECWFGESGDLANTVKIASDAEAVHWYDPQVGNNPYALLTCITDNFGTNSGRRGAYFKRGTSFGTAELGGVYPELGVFGGPIHFREPKPGDPRRAEPRVLDDYFENDSYQIPWRSGAYFPFSVSQEVNSVTKVGRLAHFECKGILTVTSTTPEAQQLYSGDFMPYMCAVIGHRVGEVIIESADGVSQVLADGISPLRMTTAASVLSVRKIFPPLTIGWKYAYYLSGTITTAT